MKNHKDNSVKFVGHDGMCTGCGACAATCPCGAVSVELEQSTGLYNCNIDEDRCTDCGKCLKVCPALNWNNEPLADGGQDFNYSPYTGSWKAVYSGYAQNEELRCRGSSGGIVSAILTSLFADGRIDLAVIVRWNPERPMEPEALLAKSPVEVVGAASPKYAPVTYAGVLKQLAKLSPETKVAFIGLPCQVMALKKMVDEGLIKAEIVVTISMVCGGFSSFNVYNYLLRKLQIRQGQVTEFTNRGNGWPGDMRITADSREASIPYGDKLSMGMLLSSPLSRPLNCQLCQDPCGFQADISVSDAWLKKYSVDKIGMSLILSKTTTGQRVIKTAPLILERVDFDEFYQANARIFTYKVNAVPLGLQFFFGKAHRKRYSSSVRSADRPRVLRQLRLKIFWMHLRLIRILQKLDFGPGFGPLRLNYFKIIGSLKYK